MQIQISKDIGEEIISKLEELDKAIDRLIGGNNGKERPDPSLS